MYQLKHRNYSGSQLNPAPIGHHPSIGVPNGTAGYYLKQNPNEWDYLYNRPTDHHKVVVQGTPAPLAYEEVKTTLPDQSMFIFANNVAHPNCCPSTYSTSQGCVCTSSHQRELIGRTRGGNNTDPTYPTSI